NNKFNKIYAFEANSKAYKYLEDNFGNDERILLSDKVINNKNGLVNFKEDIGGGMASKIFEESDNIKESISIDSLNINPTIIKLHIEGNELNALLGAVETIKRCRPIIMIFADHNKDGLYKIAKFLYSLPGYKLYFNLHDYVGNTAIFYAINNK
ncbi:FkbM family methyltransferase, partial [Brachyspira alvinipulli]|uniref:FkbM family methyltransferase n=1 Tax=Brachyspira alvinipulli TaxID=84379 RepID=UPI003004B7C6